jgi:hypothetical protein
MLTWVLVRALSLAQHGKQPGSQRQTFVSPDGVFRFLYPSAYILNTKKNAIEVGVSYISVCSDGAVCVVSRRSASEGTNFQAASFQEREIQDAATEVACLKGPPEDVPMFLPINSQRLTRSGS